MDGFRFSLDLRATLRYLFPLLDHPHIEQQ